MNLQLSLAAASSIEADALVVIACCGELPKQMHPWIEEMERTGEFAGKPNELAIIPQPSGFKARRLALFGGGKPEKFTAFEARRAAGAALRVLKQKGLRTLAFQSEPGHLAALTEGIVLGAWEAEEHKSRKECKAVDLVTIVVPGGDDCLETVFEQSKVLATAQNLARDLVNEPANLLPPRVLADRAQTMAVENGIECEILDEEKLCELGCGSLLAVAQGSSEPARLIVLRYRPQGAVAGVHLGLVGKGVTFDTGGLSIKPHDGMEKMKYDMAGGAAVIGAMQAIARLQPAITVTGFIPSVENMLGPKAQRPGDIITSLSGRTIEVLNTDAEGRLILVDAITYALGEGCTHLVDAATLTGAIGIALGPVHAGAFTNNPPLLARVTKSAGLQGEKLWPMPMDDEYREMLKSAYADLPNISSGRVGGAITAAKFLEEWVGDTPWVHLDIANMAWLDDGKPWASKGPSGFGVRTMAGLALNWAEDA